MIYQLHLMSLFNYVFLFRKIYHEDKVNQHQLFVLHWIYWPWIGSIRYFGGSFDPLSVHFYKPLACQDLDRMRNNDIFSKCGSQMEPSNFLHKWKLRWEASTNVTQTNLHLCSISQYAWEGGELFWTFSTVRPRCKIKKYLEINTYFWQL